MCNVGSVATTIYMEMEPEIKAITDISGPLVIASFKNRFKVNFVGIRITHYF